MKDPFLLREEYGHSYLALETLEEKGVFFAFTTRPKTLHTTQKEWDGVKVWATFLDSFGISPGDLVVGEQVHGDGVKVVSHTDRGKTLPTTDALVTGEEGLGLLSFYADCLPLILYDEKTNVMALAHAGWRGTLSCIGPKTLSVMRSTFSTDDRSTSVFMGPSIHPCCYEVGEEVFSLFQERFPATYETFFVKRGEGLYLDLKEANRRQFLEAGILWERVLHSKMCTSCHEDLFFSYRRDRGSTGRMSSIIYRQPEE